jgi:murein hydrolase activator
MAQAIVRRARRPILSVTAGGLPATICAVLLATAAISAEPAPQQRLEQLERAVGSERETQRRLTRELEALGRELAALRARAVTMAAALQDSEESLSALEVSRAQLDADAKTKAAAFEQRRSELAQLVAELARFGRQPPEAVLVLPGSPVEAVRTARLLGTITPALRAQATALAEQLDALQTARADLEQQQKAVAAASAQVAAERAALTEVIERRAHLQAETEAAQRNSAARLERLAREAHDVRELIERLNAERVAREAQERAQREAAERAAPEPQVAQRVPPSLGAGQLRLFSEAHGQVIAPVRGRVVLSFGQPGEGGQPHRGITVETRPAAQIVAPYDGQIAFAGPFRTYGLILIIEHTEGYHTLLAGLGRIDGIVGRVVTAGEPIGAAGSPETGNPSIYVELRRNGQPINPLPWLAPRNEKVSG